MQRSSGGGGGGGGRLWGLTVALCCLWALSLLYGEMIAYWIPLFTCSWPANHNFITFSSSTYAASNSSSSLASSMVEEDAQFLKVAVLADPQLMDRTSLGLSPGSLLLEAAQFFTDIYMKRSFRSSILPFKPDLLLFLGDLFDGGFVLSDQEWETSLNRFRHIFHQNGARKIQEIPVYYLSGNHDIGYAGYHSLYPQVIARFEREFGSRNYKFSVGKVQFIVVDAQTLDGPMEAIHTSSSWAFVKNISSDAESYQRILLTHIPLYRPDGTPCGPFRSSPVINQRISLAGPHQGIKYQNYLSEKTSKTLLDLVKPTLVLSGHDHDHCTVIHATPHGPVKEQTLGTISWQQGNLYPSFMLLTVASSAPSDSNDSRIEVLTELCFLPKQIHIYIWYLSLFVVTLLLLIVWPTSGFGTTGHLMNFLRAARSTFSSTTMKEKDEEDSCEYEMVWDAEGSMHLVKKMPTKVLDVKSDIGLTGRGNVVARPTARKQTVQEQDTSLLVELGTDTKSDGNGRLVTCSKARLRWFVQRLVRVVRLLMIVAIVNIPLYVMLLFKDWI